MTGSTEPQAYRRFHIETEPMLELTPVPPRFRVRVKRGKLLALVARELIETRGNLRVSLSRPCVYGVFSRPVGGLWPREENCVGCLRCTVEYPSMVRVEPNPVRERTCPPGLTPEQAETLLYEARTGRVPVRGAGYRGRFGGPGWDGVWLDMSEIVRPTRDGIHGRETISTAVEIGGKPRILTFDEGGMPVGRTAPLTWTEVPFILDGTALADASPVAEILARTAHRIGSLALLPAEVVGRQGLAGEHVGVAFAWGDEASPATSPTLPGLPTPPLAEVDAADRARPQGLALALDGAVVAWRVRLGDDLAALVREGAGVLHLVADAAQVDDPNLPRRLREAHEGLVAAGLRDQVTLIGSIGARQAEHAAKAIACGLDLVALDLPLWVALQAEFGEGGTRFPRRLDTEWGAGRLQNLVASWRDQLLEVLGAMGLREVRRLRGELGRTIFQDELEREAFAGIDGFPPVLDMDGHAPTA